jgi:pyruvate kinase
MSCAAHKPPPAETCEDLIRQVEALRNLITHQADILCSTMPSLTGCRQQSAQNLLHYLVFRSQDLRPLQDSLARLGLSSLGRAEPHVLASIDAVLHNLYLLSGRQRPETDESVAYTSFDEGADRLEQNTVRALGDHPPKRRVHIMVTMPAETADDYMLVHRLLENGMDCIRINCAHDDAATWSGIIKNLKYAERATGQPCYILMDLDGPKMRIGPMGSVPAVLKIKPLRASNGRVLRSARIWLTSAESPNKQMAAANASLVVDVVWLAGLRAGDRICLQDVRGSRRSWRIKDVNANGCWAEAKKTAYIANGTVLTLRGKKDSKDRETTVDGLPPQESTIRLRVGDSLLMSGGEEPGRPAVLADNGDLLSPGRVQLAIPEIYRDVRPGERVFIDDGRIEGIVEKAVGEQLQIRITNTSKPVEGLASDRGVNFPETELNLPTLDKKDLQDLKFAAQHADMVGLSFANSPDDVRTLRKHMDALGCEDTGIVLKIETARGFANLPAMLMEAMKFPACAVMIARGDLAVQCGFERMAELQEEILWVSESAHVPVIWATQVLEGLTKRGHVSRAEITDAAMGQSAECVMLNKGPHILEAVQTLDDILQRMQGHHNKKCSMLRKLHMAQAFYQAPVTS